MSKLKLLMIPIVSVAILLFAASSLTAGTTGKISGTVEDKDTGEPLPGVAVSIVGTTIGALTDDEGYFNILNVPVGTYSLKAQLVGYGSMEVTNIRVHVDLNTVYDFDLTSLTVETGEVVVVRAERPLILQDQTATLTVVSKEQIQQMPTRGYQDVVGLESGVVAFRENTNNIQRGARAATNQPAMNIRGGRQSDVAYYVDGFSQQDPLTGVSTTAINNNAIEEVQITTGGFNAEYGKVSAGVVNVTTREGASEYRGNFEVITDNFHANSYDYNIYSFDLSGPVWPDAEGFSFYISGERRWQRDRTPSAGGEKIWEMLDAKGVDIGTEDGVLPKNTRGGYTWQGKLRYDLNPQMNFRFGILGSIDEWDLYRHQDLFILDHMPRYEDKNNSMYLRLTHTLSKSTFYTASLNYFVTERKRGDGKYFDDVYAYARKGGIPEYEETGLFWQWDDPETPEDDGRIFDDYIHRESSYIGAKYDLTTQLNSSNEVKIGAEYQRHTLRYYRHLFPHKTYYEWVQNEDDDDSTYVLNSSAWNDVDRYGYDVAGEEKSDEGWNEAKHPYEMTLYLQDKFEWEGLIVNAGVRFDYFNANTLRLRDEFYPLDPERYKPRSDAGEEGITDEQLAYADSLTVEDLEDAEAETQFSPRVGVAFPVSDKTHFRFSYGKFFQRPELQYLYVNYDYLEYMLTTQPYYYAVGNPNLQPEETTAYEVGVTHRLGDNTRLDLTAYYKDVKNLTEEISTPSNPKTMRTYRNRDFGTIKGLEANLKMRRMRNVSLDLSYTLSYASGTGSYATTQSNISWQNDKRPLRVSPLDFDQRHKFTGIIDIRTTKGEGPKMGDIFPLERTGVNFVINAGSGTPYTAAQTWNEITLTNLSPRVASTINARSGPWTFRIDMKLNRAFTLFDLDFDAYLWVLNLLDRENVVDVYEGTGKPDETGWLNTDEGTTWKETYSEPNEYGFTGEEFYNLKQTAPMNYDIPRLIRFGLRLSF